MMMMPMQALKVVNWYTSNVPYRQECHCLVFNLPLHTCTVYINIDTYLCMCSQIIVFSYSYNSCIATCLQYHIECIANYRFNNIIEIKTCPSVFSYYIAPPLQYYSYCTHS